MQNKPLVYRKQRYDFPIKMENFVSKIASFAVQRQPQAGGTTDETSQLTIKNESKGYAVTLCLYELKRV